MAIAVDLVLATRPNASTGIERYALNLFDALAKVSPDIIAFIDKGFGLTEGANVIRVKGGISGWLTLPMMPEYRRQRIEMLLCPAFPPSPLMLASNTPVARIIHDDFPWTRSKSLNLRGRILFRYFENMAAPRYQAIFAPTNLMARSLSSILGRDVATIGNAPGIDLDNAPAEAERKLQIIAVGTIEPRKNYEALIRAALHLPAGWTVAVVGRNGWGEIAADWNMHVAQSHGRLDWHGHASDETLLRLYRESACFVSMSLAEGFNMPLVEAGSLGLPIVCSDIEIHRSVAPPWARFVPLSIAPDKLIEMVVEAASMVIAPSDVEAYRMEFSWAKIAQEINNRVLL